MTRLKKFIACVDRLSELSGAAGKWFAVVLVVTATYDTIARHFFNAPTIWAYDVNCIAGGVIYMLGASYDYLYNAHTRVDLFYTKMSPRWQAIMDIICSLLMFFPLMFIMLWLSVSWSIRAWRINEVLMNSFWYPPAWPYRAVFALGLLLLLLQGVSRLIKDVYFVFKGEKLS